MRLKGKFSTQHISLAAMLFTVYGLIQGNTVLTWVAVGVVFAERLFLAGVLWFTEQQMKRHAMEIAEQMGFQMQEVAKAMQAMTPAPKPPTTPDAEKEDEAR